MFKRRYGSLAIAVILIISSTINVSAATPIGEEGTQGYPIQSEMETAAEIDAINTQLASTSGSAILSADHKSGTGSTEINTGNPGNGYAQFTLAESDDFDVNEFGEIDLYVKPKAGAAWIRFYVNNGGTLEPIKSDKNGDGIYEIGTDFTSGVWNEAVIRLMDAEQTLNSVSDLVVRSNVNAAWNFDDIKAVRTNTFSFDLSNFINDQTTITDGRLQFNSNTDGTFNTSATIIASSLEAISYEDDTNAEFTAGTFSGSGMRTTTQVGTTPVATYGGTPTCYSQNTQYPVARAFDGSTDTYYHNGGSAVSGTSYLGYNYSVPKTVAMIKFIQQRGSKYSVSNFLIQYYDGPTNSWKTVSTTYSDSSSSSDWETYTINQVVSAAKWRALANSSTSSVWEVYEMQLCCPADISVYTSSAKDLTGLETLQNLRCDWTESVENGIAMEVRVSPDGGTTWTSWRACESGEAIFDYQGFSVSNGKIQYRANITGNTLLSDVKVFAQGDSTSNLVPEGQLSGIKIDREYYDTSGNAVALTGDTTAPDRYLLSFDGKNSWYSCKGGKWSLISNGVLPSTSEAKENGMTVEEINSLTRADFAKLYGDGKTIYAVDVCAYYASFNVLYTPGISRISVLLDSGTDLLQTGDAYAAVYTTREFDLDVGSWRELNKLYSVETTPKAAEIYYFANIDGTYKSMQGDAWADIGTLPENADERWAEVAQTGLTALQLRQLDKDTLTTNFLASGTSSASIVYCIKAYDDSTENYRSDIYADYTADLFEGTDLTLSLVYHDGTTIEYSGLTETQVEDFMAWLFGRQYGKGPVFYQIKTGSTYSFINYYMIQNANLLEQ